MVCDSATSWTVACQAPQSLGSPRQQYWSGVPFPSPRDLPDPGIETGSSASSALADGFFTAEPTGKPPGAQHRSSQNDQRVLVAQFSSMVSGGDEESEVRV